MAQFEFTKIRRCEDALSGSNHGWVTIEWEMQPQEPTGALKRFYRIFTPMVPQEQVPFSDSPDVSVDLYGNAVNSIADNRSNAADAEATAAQEVETIVEAQFPQTPPPPPAPLQEEPER